jgi:O-antigen/teichoic acid export membrane protein
MAMLFEIISFLILISLLFISKGKMTLALLIQYYAIHFIVKAFLFSIFYFRFFKFKEYKFNTLLLLQSGIFFLLSITGFLQSKIDVYVLKFYTDVVTLGEYHIISGFIIFAQSISSILILPYVKNIYRMQEEQLIKIRIFTAKIGVLIQTLITAIIYYLLKELYDIKLNFNQIIASFLIGYPTYIYITYVYNLYKKKLESVVLKICLLGTFLNLVLSILFLKLNYGITALLYINAFIQIICLIYYTQQTKIDYNPFKKI